MQAPPHYDAEAVRHWLDFPGCIDAVRTAMKNFSTSGKDQPLRAINPMTPFNVLALMPGFLPDGPGDDLQCYGAKIISVARNPNNTGQSKHHGIVVAFDAVTGALKCTADAGEITEIRTAAASAVATDALARHDAEVLTIFGAGAQAHAHVEALGHVRALKEIRIWARDPSKAEALAVTLQDRVTAAIKIATDAKASVADADIVCTTTGSTDPVLFGEWVRPGTHVNIVGSSGLGYVEIDSDLVVKARYVADSRRSALAAGMEFVSARDAGLITEDHIVAEIGEVLAGLKSGRTSDADITLYKSLGHIVQDLSSLDYIHARTMAE